MPTKVQCAKAVASLALAVNYCLLTGLIGGWEKWYSPSIPYRLQTEAFLRGELAISSSPDDVLHDFAWGNGGVHQVWGLGVAAVRLPFEWVANLCSATAFPDRLVLLLSLSVLFYWVLRAVSSPNNDETLAQWTSTLFEHPLRVVSFLILTFFPPMVLLAAGPFNVYEEAVLYGYIISVGLFATLLIFRSTPRYGQYCVMCLCAGLLPHFRATAGCYGLATVLIATAIAARTWRWPWVFAGTLLFVAGGLTVLVTNHVRFGSALEFGHELNLTGGDLMYMSRFANPYDDVSIAPATMELFGSVFGVKRLNEFDCYATNVVMFQSPSVRWRHFYTRTFDISYLITIILALLWGLRAWSKTPTSERRCKNSPLTLGLLWGMTASIPLFAFYLNFHATSSRYMLDFAPAFAAILATACLQADVHARSHAIASLTALGVLTWMLVEVTLGTPGAQPTPTLTLAEVSASHPRLHDSPALIPTIYEAQSRTNSDLTRGWHEQGATEPVVCLFVRNLGQLSLEVRPADGKELTDEQCWAVRAKVGLEELPVTSVTKIDQGYRINFPRPQHSQYRKGIHQLFLAMSPSQRLPVPRTHFLLMRVADETD